jgi:coenzyme F420-reducing hydrogenase delta subunit
MSKSANVVVFACNWDGLSCVEAAAQAGLNYPASVRVVRVNCLSRVNQGLMLKAFELGAEAVLLLGCELGNCHFDIDTRFVEREQEKARGILRLLGFSEDRLVLARMSRGDGAGFVRRVKGLTQAIEQAEAASPAAA